MSFTFTPPPAVVKVRNGLNINNGFIEIGGPLVRNTDITGVNQSFSIDIDNGNQASSFGVSPGNVGISSTDSSGLTDNSTQFELTTTGIGLDAFGVDGVGNAQVASLGVENGSASLGVENQVTGDQQLINAFPAQGLGLHVIDTLNNVGISLDEIYEPDLNANTGLNLAAGGQFPQFERVVAGLTSVGQNASIPDYLVYTNTTYSSLMVTAWLTLYGAGTVQIDITFTDIQGTPQAVSFPVSSGAGFFALNPIQISSQGAKDVTVNVINVGGVTFDIAVIIMASQNN